jgi:hypothetical protein
MSSLYRFVILTIGKAISCMRKLFTSEQSGSKKEELRERFRVSSMKLKTCHTHPSRFLVATQDCRGCSQAVHTVDDIRVYPYLSFRSATFLFPQSTKHLSDPAVTLTWSMFRRPSPAYRKVGRRSKICSTSWNHRESHANCLGNPSRIMIPGRRPGFYLRVSTLGDRAWSPRRFPTRRRPETRRFDAVDQRVRSSPVGIFRGSLEQ